ncbi:Late competence protein ComEC, DNA transport [Streptococcus sp. DD10]|nr:Late competence protein ComEC, DNA transport [Streptococcus sp. DD10]
MLAWVGFIIFLLCFVSNHKGKEKYIACLFMSCFALWFSYQNYQTKVNENLEHREVSQIVILPDTIKINGDALSFRGKANGQNYSVYYNLKTEKEKKFFQNLDQLMVLKVKGELSYPEQRRNFKGFDYAAYLKTQGIYRTLKLNQIESIKLSSSWNPFDLLSSSRRKALVWIKTHFPSPMNHYMTGLLFGYLDHDFEEMNDVYSSLGIIHLFALSGMQVGFFLDGFRKGLLRIGLTIEQVKWFTYPFAFFYAGITGFSVSVVRSLLQKILAQHNIKKLDNLAITFLILCFIMPKFLLTAGGVLSCAYAVILTMTSFEHVRGLKRFLIENLVISLGILPLLSFYFGEFQPFSILLTFVFSILFDLILLPGLGFIFLLSPILNLSFLNRLFEWLESLIRLLATSLRTPLVFGQPDHLVLLSLLFLLALLYDFRDRKKVAVALSLMTCFLFFITKFPLENEITIVDVGQGDSIFLRDMMDKTVLIDVGGKPTFGKKELWQEKVTQSNASRTLLPYLKSRGVGAIDSLVLTHTDTDHVGDLLELAKEVKINEIYVSRGSLTNKDFVKKLEKVGTVIRVAEKGIQIPIFGSYLEALYPYDTGDGGNNDSIVLYGEFLGDSFLFTGDLEEDGEKELLALYPNLEVDVLKAGHHGSKGSSSQEFLGKIKPKISLISAGINNRYRHPHQETLERFDEIGTEVYRTDQQGAIRFTGWTDWKIETVRE